MVYLSMFSGGGVALFMFEFSKSWLRIRHIAASGGSLNGCRKHVAVTSTCYCVPVSHHCALHAATPWEGIVNPTRPHLWL